MKKVVYNIKNERGNIVANQFHIIEGMNHTFVSYQTTIAELHVASAFIKINEYAFNYSRTTTRHFLNWMYEALTNSKPSRKNVESWIKQGYIPASENCYNTNIDIKLVNEEEF